MRPHNNKVERLEAIGALNKLLQNYRHWYSQGTPPTRPLTMNEIAERIALLEKVKNML